MATKATTLFALATVKTWLGTTQSTKDSQLTWIADAVTALIERETRVQFVQRQTVELQDGTGHRKLWLTQYPIVTVEALTIKRHPDDTTPETIAATDYEIAKARGVLRLKQTVFTRGLENVSVTYTHGYGAQDAVTLPSDIYQVGLDLVKLIWDESSSGAIAASSINVGLNGANLFIKPDWPKHIKATLMHWRRPDV